MDEYKENHDYEEIPVPTGDGWHKPDDGTAGAVPQYGWQQPDRSYPSGTGQSQGGSTPPTSSWICSCGTVNTGKFCTECGKPAPVNGGQQPGGLYPQTGGQSQSSWQQNEPSQNNWQPNSQPQNSWQPSSWQPNSQPQNNWQQDPYQQPPYQQAPPKENNPLALAAMITGLLALITCCCSPLIQFPLAVASIVLVILSKRGKPFSGYAIAGLIMSIFAILLSILMTFMIGLVRSPQYQEFLNSPEFQDIFDDYESLYESFYGGEDLDSIYESIYDDYR